MAHDFRGLEVRPYCQTAEMPRVCIDRTQVEGYVTLFGETEFVVTGQKGRTGERWPLTRAQTDFPSAWALKTEIDRRIDEAWREQENGKGDRRNDETYQPDV